MQVRPDLFNKNKPLFTTLKQTKKDKNYQKEESKVTDESSEY